MTAILRRQIVTVVLLASVCVNATVAWQIFSGVRLDDHARRADYLVFLLGGTMFTHGDRDATMLYDIAHQTAVEQQLTVGSPFLFPDRLIPFVHPPYVAVLAAPMAGLSAGTGFVIWVSFQLICLIFALWLLQAMLPPAYRYLLWLGAFAYWPLYQNFLYGQIAPLLLLSLALTWWLLWRGGAGAWWAGAALAICLIKPHLLILPLLYLLYRRLWPTLISFVACAVLTYLGTAMLFGFAWPFPYLARLNWMSGQQDHYGMAYEKMSNLRGLFARFGWDSFALVALSSAVLIAALLYAWRYTDHPTIANKSSMGGRFELGLAATLVASVLTSIYLFNHDLVILLFPGAVLLGWAAQHRFPRWLVVLLLGNIVAAPLLLFNPPINALPVLAIIVGFAANLVLLMQQSPASLTEARVEGSVADA